MQQQNKQPNLKMGKGLELTFHPKKFTDGQEAHEKLLNITNYQRNANQNHNEVSPHTSQKWASSENLQTTNAGEDVEKREPSCTVSGNVN